MSGGRGWRPAGRNRRLAAVAVALCAIGVLGLTASPAPAAEASRAFSALASSHGVRLTYRITDFAISEAVDAGAPVVQAQLESAGLSRGFASIPYPGDTVISAPGLIAAATGQSLCEIAGDPEANECPGYPLYAAADYPGVPESEVSDPQKQVIMRAKAEENAIEALARVLPGVAGTEDTALKASGTRSSSVVTRASDGTITSFAETVVEGIAAEGVFSIASVRSTSRSVLRPGDDKPTTKTELSIDGALVSGVRVGFGPEGLVLASQTVPVPTADLTKQLNEALKDAGISIRVLEGEELVGGKASDVLEITTEHASPGAGLPAGTLTYQIGGATSFILSGTAVDLPPLPSGGNIPVPPAAPPVAAPTNVLGGSTTAPPAVTPEQPVPTQPTAIARDMRDAIKVFYLVLGVGAALGLASSGLWRRKGGLVPWTS